MTGAAAAPSAVCDHARVHRRGGRNWRVAALATLALLSLVAALAPATAIADPPILSVQVGADPVGRAMPPGFLGLSFEYKATHVYTGRNPDAVNPVLVVSRRARTGRVPPPHLIQPHVADRRVRALASRGAAGSDRRSLVRDAVVAGRLPERGAVPYGGDVSPLPAARVPGRSDFPAVRLDPQSARRSGFGRPRRPARAIRSAGPRRAHPVPPRRAQLGLLLGQAR